MEAPNPSRPLDCEVDILRLAVRKKNGLGHELLGSIDNGEQQQREKSQHCFRFNSCLRTTSTTSTSTFLLRTGRFQVFSLSVFTCFTRSPPSGARSPGATSGGRPAELRKRTGWRAIGPPQCFHIPVPVPLWHCHHSACIYLCHAPRNQLPEIPLTSASHWAKA